MLMKQSRRFTRDLRKLYTWSQLQQMRQEVPIVPYSTAVVEDGVFCPTVDHSKYGTRPFSEIPGPRALPFIGTIYQHLPGGIYYQKPLQFIIDDLYDKYGSICRGEILGLDLVHLYKPEDFEAVFRAEGKYPIRRSFYTLRNYREKYNENIHGLITSQGKDWYRFRSQVQQKMLRPKAVSAYIDSQEPVADDLVKRIQHSQDSDGIVEDLRQDFLKYAMEAIAVVCFNKRIGALEERLNPEAEQFLSSVSNILTTSNNEFNELPFYKLFETPKYKRFRASEDFIVRMSMQYASEALRRLEQTRISKQEVDGEHGDLIPYLMTKTSLSELEVITVISEFFFGGTDTTSNLLAFCLYLLAVNGEKQDNLRKEIDNVLPKNGKITSEEINKLPYLRAVLKETHRVLPVAPGNCREAPTDLELRGYNIPKGTTICLHLDWTCRQERYFKNAKSFVPERWLRNSGTRHVHPFIVLPYGHGPRSCPGRRFAEQEVSLALIKILRNFQVEYVGDEFQIETTVVNKPALPLKFKFASRHHSNH